MGRIRTFIDNATSDRFDARSFVAFVVVALMVIGVLMGLSVAVIWVISEYPWAAVGLLFVGFCGAVWYASGEPKP